MFYWKEYFFLPKIYLVKKICWPQMKKGYFLSPKEMPIWHINKTSLKLDHTFVRIFRDVFMAFLKNILRSSKINSMKVLWSLKNKNSFFLLKIEYPTGRLSQNMVNFICKEGPSDVLKEVFFHPKKYFLNILKETCLGDTWDFF